MTWRLHIVGAGLAGLACGVSASAGGIAVCVYEAARRAGGRCRSFHDASLDRLIDNGNHIILGGNRAALDYLHAIGASDRMMAVEPPAFPFMDLRDRRQWTLVAGLRGVPGLLSHCRGPGGGLRQLARVVRLARALPAATVAEILGPDGTLYERVWWPIATSVLNTRPEQASARLMWTSVARTLLRGAAASRPYIARTGLGDALVDPAIAYLKSHGGAVRLGKRVTRLGFDANRLATIELGDTTVALDVDDAVVMALPPAGANALLPGLRAPEAACAIVNAHFRLDAPANMPGGAPILGLIGGTAEWIFARGDMVSVTVSAADALASRRNDAVAKILWADVALALELPTGLMPPVRIIKEKRATPAQTPDFAVGRNGPQTPWPNLWLAGDWTDTGLPATIEGAIASGQHAARLAAEAMG